MLRRLFTAAAVAAVAVTASVPSHAAAPVKLYLNELTSSCQDGRVNAITTSPDDSGGCVVIPRVLVDGQGLDNESESFVSIKQLKSFKIDSSKKLTGTFALFGSSGNNLAPGAANVSAIFTIKMAKKKIGTVTVSGVATPATPAAQTFSLSIPKELNKVSTNSVQVSVQWVTCVGLCGVAVSGASFMDVPTR